MNKRKLIAYTGAGLALAATGVATGAIPDATSGVITSCYDSTGTVRVIDRQSGTTCPAGSTQLQWNMQGRQGPTGMRGPQGAPGDNRTFWVRLGARGEDRGKSGPKVFGGGSNGYYYLYVNDQSVDVTRCAVQALPESTGFPLDAEIYYVASTYVYVSLKQVKTDVWPLSYKTVEAPVHITASCGTTA